MSLSPEEGKRRRWVRLGVRCCVLVVAVVLALDVLPWSRGPMVVPALSVHVLVGSAVAIRAIGLATWVGLPVLLIVLVRRRWFCRYVCPVGLMTEYAGRVRSPRKSLELIEEPLTPNPSPRKRGEGSRVSDRLSVKRLPHLGRWIVLLTLGGACFGYPLFLWLDPLAIFGGAFTLWHDPLSLAGRVSAATLGAILLLSLLVPGAWCLRICPLGATQDLLSLPRTWLGRPLKKGATAGLSSSAVRILPKTTAGQASSGTQIAKPLLSRRSLIFAGLGATCVALGGRWAVSARARAGRRGSKLLRPPGAAGGGRFTGLCIRCGNCIRACPAGIIEPASGGDGIAGFLAPVIRFEEDYCREDCHRCTQVCPSGAISQLSLEEKNAAPIGLAKVDASICLLSDDRECDICARACPYEAIDIVWSEEEYLALPRVDAEKCPGCGACEVLCPGTNEWERQAAEEPIPLRKAVEVRPPTAL